MTPIHFGKATSPLFGVYHPPSVGMQSAPSRAVLICGSYGDEAIRSHDVLRQLCSGFAEKGVACLRFDYRGTGESSGAGHEVTLTTMAEDIVTASEELRRLSGGPPVVWFGHRVGAMVAISALGQIPEPSNSGDDTHRAFAPDQLGFWDPVLDGRAFIGALRAAHRVMLPAGGHLSRLDEAMGHPLPEELETAMIRFTVPPGLARPRRVTVFSPTPMIEGATHVSVRSMRWDDRDTPAPFDAPRNILSTIVERLAA